MTREEAAFQAALDRDPADHATRLVFADWLDERDDPRAGGYRALVAVGALAYFAPCGGWTYGNYNVANTGDQSALPRDWWTLVTNTPYATWKAWRSRREADDAVALAFARLPLKRRAELLSTSPPVEAGT
jgi:uncharacterized protein (TIGR02996 family)